MKHFRMVAGLFILFFATCCRVDLQQGLSERDANEIVVMLQAHGIDALKVYTEQGQTMSCKITVDRKQLVEAMKMMEKYKLPRNSTRGFGELFSQKGMVPTSLEEKAAYMDALSNELAHTLMTVDGVVDARVHLVLPEENPFQVADSSVTYPSRAAVLIKYISEGAVDLNDDSIRQLVSSSVMNLNPGDVSVVWTKVPVKNAAVPVDAAGSLESYNLMRIIAAAGTSGTFIMSGAVIFLAMRVKKLRTTFISESSNTTIIETAQ